MFAYIITLTEEPLSVEAADRCAQSAIKHGIKPVYFPATPMTAALAEMKNRNLRLGQFNTTYARIDAVVGCFLSHFRLWEQIALTSAGPFIICEHDAMFIAGIPEELNAVGGIVNIGAPSYGKYRMPPRRGLQPMCSKKHLPGSHAYIVSPDGARRLIRTAFDKGIEPVDLFVSLDNIPDIKEYYPWLAISNDTFTTVQREAGCLRKHNYKNGYKILT